MVEGQLNAKLATFLSNYFKSKNQTIRFTKVKMISTEILRIKKEMELGSKQSLDSMEEEWEKFLTDIIKSENQEQKKELVNFLCIVKQIFSSLLIDGKCTGQGKKTSFKQNKISSFHSSFLFLRIIDKLNQDLVLCPFICNHHHIYSFLPYRSRVIQVQRKRKRKRRTRARKKKINLYPQSNNLTSGMLVVHDVSLSYSYSSSLLLRSGSVNGHGVQTSDRNLVQIIRVHFTWYIYKNKTKQKQNKTTKNKNHNKTVI